jgi:YVTN family beta-propeller protein
LPLRVRQAGLPPAGVGPPSDDLAVLKETCARRLIFTGSWTPLAKPTGIVAAGGRGPYVGSFAQSEVAHVDPPTRAVNERVTLPGRTALFVAAGAGSLWITQPPADFHASPPSAITRVSILDYRVQDRFSAPVGVLPGQVEAIIPTGGEPLAVAAGAGAIWVTNQAAGTISRIDPGTKTVVKTVRVGFNPHGLAFCPRRGLGRGRKATHLTPAAARRPGGRPPQRGTEVTTEKGVTPLSLTAHLG